MKNYLEWIGTPFNYGKLHKQISCDCFGLFVGILLEKYPNNKTVKEILKIFVELYHKPLICFTKIHDILHKYSTKLTKILPNELIVLKKNHHFHCGITIMYNNEIYVLHACEKHGVILTSLQRFLLFGMILEKYKIFF